MKSIDARVPSILLSLPDELLLAIVSSLAPPRGFQPTRSAEVEREVESAICVGALHALTLTSQKLHAITQPILYSSFIEPCQDPGDFKRHGKDTALVCLLRTILRKPALALHIQYAKIIFNGERYPPPDDVASFIAEVTPQLESLNDLAVAEYLWDICDDHFSLTGEGVHYLFNTLVLVTLLLTLSPNLTSLSMITSPYYDQATMEAWGKMGRLRDLEIWNTPSQCHEDEPTALMEISDFIMVPSHRFVIRAVNLSDMDLRWESLGPAHVQDLVFDKCEIAPVHLESALRTCESLKSFTCRWGIPVDSRCLWGEPSSEEVQPMPIELPDLGTALAKHKDTLEHLELDTLDSDWVFSIDQEIDTIGSLQHFTSLKTLIVSGLVLFNDNESTSPPETSTLDELEYSAKNTNRPLASILPSSLEYLTIRVECDAVLEDNLLTLLQHCQQYRSDFPNLRVIDCTWDVSPASCQDTLIQPFAELGIDLRMKLEGPEDSGEWTMGPTTMSCLLGLCTIPRRQS